MYTDVADVVCTYRYDIISIACGLSVVTYSLILVDFGFCTFV